MIFSRRNTEAKSPDKASIGALYDKHAPWLLGVCLRYTGNREDAEDVLHDGFMKIIRTIEGFEEKKTGSLEAWMRRIMVNTALNHIRDHGKEKMFTGLDNALNSERTEDENEEDKNFSSPDLTKDQLMEMICELPAGYRMVFNLYVMENYSHKEITELLNCSENTSKSQLFKARSFLKKRLFEYQNKVNYEQTVTSRR